MSESHHDEHDTLPPSLDPAIPDHILDPPTTFLGRMKQIGPGLIIAASIVGSGELIATTKTGAQAGISLLWLIIIGCLIKVFVQVELGRYTISHGETTLAALDRVPGPKLKVNGIVWFWVFMTLAGLGQLGGIVGGVGQALALTIPVTRDYEQAIEIPSENELKRFIKWEDDFQNGREEFNNLPQEHQKRIARGHEILTAKLDHLGSERKAKLIQQVRSGESLKDPWTWDDKIWAAVISVLTAFLLYHGRYRLLQTVSLWLVGLFTFITIGNVISLQLSEEFHLSWSQILQGFTFSLPPATVEINPLTTALATFGIIGVGASELVAYPYWCIEKGYAKYTGPRTNDASWTKRARGWMQIMHYDAFASMVLYTVATLLFFVMGVAVLHNEGRDPDGMRMVASISQAYVPVFGPYARWLFLIGAIAVLYSTFMAANAANTRMYADALKMFDLIDRHSEQSHQRAVKGFSIALPLFCLLLFCTGLNPVTLILISGFMQAAMLPLLGLAALYFRYRHTDNALKPNILWDLMLGISCIGLMLFGFWAMYDKIAPYIGKLLGAD